MRYLLLGYWPLLQIYMHCNVPLNPPEVQIHEEF